jgi:hypothetical protein
LTITRAITKAMRIRLALECKLRRIRAVADAAALEVQERCAPAALQALAVRVSLAVLAFPG